MHHLEQQFQQRIGQFLGSQVAVGSQQGYAKPFGVTAKFKQLFDGHALAVRLQELQRGFCKQVGRQPDRPHQIQFGQLFLDRLQASLAGIAP